MVNAMGWKDLLEHSHTEMIFPWVGQLDLRQGPRLWSLVESPPVDVEYGWHAFALKGRLARYLRPAEPRSLNFFEVGYLVCDRLVRDDIDSKINPMELLEKSQKVHLLPNGLSRFARVKAGRTYRDGHLIFVSEEMPVGPEGDAQIALEDGAIAKLRGAPPGLYAALELELWRRREATRQRALAEAKLREQELALAAAEKAARIKETLGDGETRRALAETDFLAAATAALAVGGAEYLDHRPGNRGEMIVRFKLLRRRFECVCNKKTLRIIDSGICLRDHGMDEEEIGDTYFTLESLPGVIAQASREGRLHVFRHVI